LDEAGDDIVSDIDPIILSLPTQHQIIGREIRYAMEIFKLNLRQEYFASLISGYLASVSYRPQGSVLF